MTMMEAPLDNFGQGHEGDYPGLAPDGVPLLPLLPNEFTPAVSAPSPQPAPEAAGDERPQTFRHLEELEEPEGRRLLRGRPKADNALLRRIVQVVGYEPGTPEAYVAAQAFGRLLHPPRANYPGAPDRGATMRELVARIIAGHQLTQEEGLDGIPAAD